MIISYSESALRMVCKSFDTNGDGTIDKAEMSAVFEDLQRNLSSAVRIAFKATLSSWVAQQKVNL